MVVCGLGNPQAPLLSCFMCIGRNKKKKEKKKENQNLISFAKFNL